MSRFVTRATAARAVVLLVVAALALSTHQLSSSGSRPRPADEGVRVDWFRALADAPPPSAVTPAPALVPAADHAQRPGHVGKRGHHRARAGARLAPGRHGRAARAAGQDISWPQCPIGGPRKHRGEPMPAADVQFLVIGLTAGRAFRPNPCLAQHLGWAQQHHVAASAYAFAAFPSRRELRRHGRTGPYDAGTHAGRLRNAGFATARYNVRLMADLGFATPHVWLDVEPSSSHPWSHRRRLNRAVVRGWIAGYRAAGYTVGFYSTHLLWRRIVGHYRPALPEWRTAGPSSRRAAGRMCHQARSFQGGTAVIAQWWTRHRDFDRLCPTSSRDATLAEYFHQW